ncbi:MAG: cardiolipin synthase [Cetobacterium sp.]|uniref:cardiolipin synthase n=1 Tax=Cetobacterium sp. TaxID=2071632 RepID=UPI003F2F13CA
MKEILIALKDYLVFINIIFAAIVIFFERKRPVFTLFWIMILLLTSYFGFIMYLFFGISFKKRRALSKYYLKNSNKYSKNIKKKSMINIKKWIGLSKYLDGVLLGKMTHNNSFVFYRKNESFFSSLTLAIKESKKNIYMEYYVFDDDEVGGPIYDAILEKAKESIEIKIIIDGAGTRGVSRKRLKELRNAGVMIEIFFPSYFPFIKIGNLRANYRNHRKISLIDNEVLFSGGLNIGKDYLGKGKLGNWQDIGFSIKGEAIVDYLHEFERSWKFLKKDTTDLFENPALIKKDYQITPIQVVSSGPNYEFHTIKDTILNLIIKAEKSIMIETPYFIPDEPVMEALKGALVSGIKIKIVIPNIGDHAFVYWANQYFYGELLELGAEIYKYKNGFIHSKLMIVDREIAFLGTANFDYRSMYQNFEINLLILGINIIELENRIKSDIQNSEMVKIEDYKNRGKKERVLESISKLIAPIL